MTNNPLLAFVWMLGAAISFSTMAVAGREVMVELDTFELMLFRSAIGLTIILVLLSRHAQGFAQIKTPVMRLHIIRNLFHYTGQNLWFYGVFMIPLSQLVALEFTNPLWVVLLAPLLLSEKLTRIRLISAAIGFLGVLIVARPGYAPIELGHLAGLGAAIGFALNTIYTKRIMSTDSVLCVLFWMTLLQMGASFVISLPGGITLPSAQLLPWVALIGVAGLTAHYSLTSALGAAPATIVAPLEFIRLPVIAILGMVIYDEPLLLTVFIGAVVIMGGNLLNIYTESRRA